MKTIEDQLCGLWAKIKDNNALLLEMSTINKKILGLKLHRPPDPEMTEISLLCELHSIINSDANLPYFTKIKQRKTIEEMNLTIVSRIHQIIVDKYNLNQKQNLKKNNQELNKKLKTALFWIIVPLGTIFAATNAISILQGLLTTFTALSSIPNMVLVPIEILCAGLGVLGFYGFELHIIGKPLGIRAFETGKVFKLYGQQAAKYQEAFGMLHQALHAENLSASNLEFLAKTSSKLNDIYTNFGKKTAEAIRAKEKPSKSKTILRRGFTGVAATIFGIIGMAAAPSFVSTFIFPFLTVAAATGPIGLMITIGAFVVFFGVGALLYVLIERNAVNKLVDRFAGTPTKAMNQINDCDSNIKKTQDNINLLAAKNKKILDKGKFEAPYIRSRAPLNQFRDWKTQKEEEKQDQSSSSKNVNPSVRVGYDPTLKLHDIPKLDANKFNDEAVHQSKEPTANMVAS